MRSLDNLIQTCGALCCTISQYEHWLCLMRPWMLTASLFQSCTGSWCIRESETLLRVIVMVYVAGSHLTRSYILEESHKKDIFSRDITIKREATYLHTCFRLVVVRLLSYDGLSYPFMLYVSQPRLKPWRPTLVLREATNTR